MRSAHLAPDRPPQNGLRNRAVDEPATTTSPRGIPAW